LPPGFVISDHGNCNSVSSGGTFCYDSQPGASTYVALITPVTKGFISVHN
jgi:hypothetical protein